MNNSIISKLQSYIKETLDIIINPIPWKNQTKLPFFLKNLYDFYKATFLGKEIVLMIEKDVIEKSEGNTPAVIKKHIKAISDNKNNNNLGVVYISKTIVSYNRKRLVQHQIPFIIPGNQMYLPILGIDFREHYKDNSKKSVKKLSPSAQVLLLNIMNINNGSQKVYTPKEASIITGYSQMSMGRAFNELEHAEIGEHSKIGKERRLSFNNDQDLDNKKLWNKILPYLQSPIKKRIYIVTEKNQILSNNNLPLSGLSALSGYTMLAEPMNQTYAISQSEWKKIKQESVEKIKEIKFAEPGAIEIEIWTYSPKLIMKQDYSNNPTSVDKISLYLTLLNNTDERIQGELEKMMEEFI